MGWEVEGRALLTTKSEVFSTAADGQTSVEVNVLQVCGEVWGGKCEGWGLWGTKPTLKPGPVVAPRWQGEREFVYDMKSLAPIPDAAFTSVAAPARQLGPLHIPLSLACRVSVSLHVTTRASAPSGWTAFRQHPAACPRWVMQTSHLK